MKKIIALLTALFIAMPTFVEAQSKKDIEKVLNGKASKAVRKEAKNLKKAGWKVLPGALPLDKQLERSYTMQLEVDDEMFPKYIMADAMSNGETYDAAKIQATELAKTIIAGQIQTEVTTLIQNTVANKQLSANEATSIVETVMASKNLISQSLGRTIPVVEAYKKGKDVYDVTVRIAYSHEMAKKLAKKILLDELEKKGNDLHKKLDSLMQ